MASIAFTDNVRDLSNNNGYQFEFHCERCGNGYRSAFRADKIARGENILQSAGRLFGGKVQDMAYAAGNWAVSRQTNSAAKDRALDAAVQEISPKFNQCRGCGDWVCAEVCWNDEVGQCTRCSPFAADQLAQAQAQERAFQMRDRLHDVNLLGATDLKAQSVTVCPQCRAGVDGGKFCPECGASLAPKIVCPQCQQELSAGSRFCAGCGAQQMA